MCRLMEKVVNRLENQVNALTIPPRPLGVSPRPQSTPGLLPGGTRRALMAAIQRQPRPRHHLTPTPGRRGLGLTGASLHLCPRLQRRNEYGDPTTATAVVARQVKKHEDDIASLKRVQPNKKPCKPRSTAAAREGPSSPGARSRPQPHT